MQRKRFPLPLLLSLLVAAGLLVPSAGQARSWPASSACFSQHGRLYLAVFTGGGGVGSQFYAERESAGSVTTTIRLTPGDCRPGGTIVQADYTTEDGSAVAGQDYTATSGTTDEMCDDVHRFDYCPPGMPRQHQVPVPITVDGPDAAAVESFWFHLTGGGNGLAEPSSAPVHVIDVDGTPRASLEPTVDGGAVVTYSRSETFSMVKIPVFLAGSPGNGSVAYTVEPDPASPATPGEDFSVTSGNPLDIVGGVGFIEFAIVNDDLGEGPESVVITLVPGGVEVAEPSSTTLTILDNEESVAPFSRFHHPKHGKTYPYGSYRVREMHVFARDEPGGSGVVEAQMALRKKMKGGKCHWWNGSRWKRGGCAEKRWLSMPAYEEGWFYYLRVPTFRPSVGTRIRNYKVFSRALDGARNVEGTFVKARNKNTFNIAPR